MPSPDDLAAIGRQLGAGGNAAMGQAGAGAAGLLASYRKKRPVMAPGAAGGATDGLEGGLAGQGGYPDAETAGQGPDAPQGPLDGLQALLERARASAHQDRQKPRHAHPGQSGGLLDGSPFAQEAKFRAWYSPVARDMGLHPDPERTGVDMRRVHKLATMSGKSPAEVMMAMDHQQELLTPQDHAISQYFAVGNK